MKSRYTRRRLLLQQAGFVALATLFGGVAGCGNLATPSTSYGSSTVTSEPLLGSIPKVTDWRQIRLPLDSYALSLRDTWRIDRAEAANTRTCMRRFGLSYTGGPSAQEPSTPDIWPTHYRLYGLLDEAHAVMYGYHNGEIRSPEKYAMTSTPVSRDYFNVVAAKLGGGTYKGQRIPPGGCIGEARRIMAGGGPAFDPSLPERLSGESWLRSNSDTRVVAAFATWSSCMAGAGYRYRTPINANDDDRWSGDRPTKAEIAVATADVRCKKQTNDRHPLGRRLCLPATCNPGASSRT